MSDDRNLDIEEQLSILFDDIDDAAAKSAEETRKAEETVLDSVASAAEPLNNADEVPMFTEMPDDFDDVKKPEEISDAVKNAESEIDKMPGEVRNVRESVEDAASQAAVFVDADVPEQKGSAAPEEAQKAKAAADDTKIRGDQYKGIDFDSFESVIGDDDDEEALIPGDLTVTQKEADEEFDDDDEDDEDEIGGKTSAAKRKSTARSSRKDKAISADTKKEAARFWIFTAIVALIVAAAVLFILWSRGIIGNGRQAQPSSSEPAVTDDTEPSSSEEQTSEEPSTEEPDTDAPESDSEPETDETEPSEDEESGGEDADAKAAVLDNYTNPFMVVGTGTLNVREQPDASSKIIGTIDEFGGGDILEQSGEWFRVTTGGLTGYVNGSFIAGAQDIADQAAEHAVQQVRINAENGVNIRSAASTEAEILQKADNKSLWEYVGEEEGFYKIKVDDSTEGYVSSEFSEVGWFLKEAAPYYEN